MLMLTGVVIEITSDGTKQMALFTSPRVPGSHFKIEVDSDTAARLRLLINTESVSAEVSEQLTEQFFGMDEDGEEETLYDPFGRN